MGSFVSPIAGVVLSSLLVGLLGYCLQSNDILTTFSERISEEVVDIEN
jgi:hypothetical protein